MRNIDVVKHFLVKQPASTTHLVSTGDLLFSYNTCIAQWITGKGLYINTTKYSRTTSTHTSMLKRNLLFQNVVEVENVPINTRILIDND